ncbi:hypothetical protein [Streptomyces sp. NPDC005476]|uniref:hypothetical protein n=1 Tax=Streptomyces sp. NPDC005476 TaxID=3156882 RepID=UPI00345444A3
MTETSLPPGQGLDRHALVRSCDQALRRHGLVPEQALLAGTHVEVIPYAHPVPTLGRDEVLAQVVPWSRPGLFWDFRPHQPARA